MLSWLKQNKTELIVLLFLGLLVNVFSYITITGRFPFENIVDGIAFFDPDDYMRLVRMNEWFGGKDFFDTIIERANSPFGGDMHWTRFYDLFWYIPVKIVEFFTKDTKAAVAYVGFFISPVFALFSGCMVFRMMQYLMDKRDAFITSALFLVHDYIVIQTIFGRPDYHSFIIFMITLYMLLLIKLIMDDCKNNKVIIATAIVAALCIYASPETLIPLLLSEAVLFSFSFKKSEIFKCLILKSKYTFISLLFLYVLNNPELEFKCISVLVCMVCTVFGVKKNDNKNPACILVVIINSLCCFIFQGHGDYDKLSLIHVNLYFNIAMFYYIYSLYPTNVFHEKVKRSLIIGGIFFVMFLIVCPRFFLGMEANVDAYAKKVWLSNVEEMQSPLKGDFCYSFIITALINLIAGISKIYTLCKNKNVSRETISWVLFVVIGIVYTIFGCMAFRMAPYAVMFMNPVVIDFVMNGEFFKKLPRIIKVLIVLGVILLVQILPTYASQNKVSSEEKNTSMSSKNKVPPEEKNASIEPRSIYKLIDDLSEKSKVVLASIDIGPRLLWFTKHKIVAAPYHRHTSGIIAEYEILRNKFDASNVKRHLLKTQTKYIVISKRRYFCEKGEACRGSLGYYFAKYADYNGWTKPKRELEKLVPPEILEWFEIVPLGQKLSSGRNMLHDIVIAKVLLGKK